MITLKLTSPLMGTNKHSEAHIETIALQTALKSRGWYDRPVDGVYGSYTAQAVKRAKFYLGYVKPDNANNIQFWNLLTGKAEPTLAQVKLAMARRKAADKAAKAVPLGEKALKFLINKTGITEHPANSNRCVVSEWYGLIGPWCAMTGMWAYDSVGSKVFNKVNGHKYNWAYVPNIVNDARNGHHGLMLTHDPKPGDGVCYDWPGESKGVADHYGTFEKWISKRNGTFYAREGNTAVGNDSNGGKLMQRSRTTSTVVCFVRIGANVV